MGALHYVEAISPVGSGSTVDEIGWAVGAGIHLNMPFLGARDSLLHR